MIMILGWIINIYFYKTFSNPSACTSLLLDTVHP